MRVSRASVLHAVALNAVVPLLLHRLAPRAADAATDVAALSIKPTAGGAQYVDFRLGDGPSPRYGQLIRFHYVGYTVSEEKGTLKVVDSSYRRERPYLTKHGNGFTCLGIEEALHTMAPGGQRRVILPPALSFTGDKGPVPPDGQGRDAVYTAVNQNRPLVYDLELLSVTDDLVDRGDYDDISADDSAKYLRKAV